MDAREFAGLKDLQALRQLGRANGSPGADFLQRVLVDTLRMNSQLGVKSSVNGMGIGTGAAVWCRR